MPNTGAPQGRVLGPQLLSATENVIITFVDVSTVAGFISHIYRLTL